MAKRRFEVAEQTLTTFHRASDALSKLRSPMLWAGELESVEVPKDLGKEDEMRVRQYNVYATRAEAAAPAFAELRTAQILAEIHLGPAAADAIDDLFRCRQEVVAAVDELLGQRPPNTSGLEGHELREHQEFQKSMRRAIAQRRRADGRPAEDDKLSMRIDLAKAAVERACRPFLDDPPWLKGLTAFIVRSRGPEN